MKYQLLTSEQLAEMEQEFVDFLVVNGVTADDWESLKTKENPKAEAIIAQFSDVVWEGVLRKARYLEKYTPSSIYCFFCPEDELHLLKINDHRAIADLTDPEYRNKAVDGSMHVTTQQATKFYNGNREEELFQLIRSGCELTDGSLYRSVVPQES